MRKRLSPGVILGVFAVVLACTGTAAAGSLITSSKIKDGTIQSRDIKQGAITADRLTTSVRNELKKAGTPGAKGDKGDTGAAGAPGATVQGSAPRQGDQGPAGPRGDKGDTGPQGEKGDTGAAGKDAANPATLVSNVGDAGWIKMGGGSADKPASSIAGGALRLQGSFDSDTPAGAIGVAQDYHLNPVPLSSLKTLSYDFRVLKRPAGTVNAPVIHITLTGANTGAASTFANLVFEPYNQGSTPALNQWYSFDTLAGQWWATKKVGDIERQQTVSWDQMVATNPDAKITFINVDNGGSSAGTIPADQFAADADNVVVGFGSAFTRYDFGG